LLPFKLWSILKMITLLFGVTILLSTQPCQSLDNFVHTHIHHFYYYLIILWMHKSFTLKIKFIELMNQILNDLSIIECCCLSHGWSKNNQRLKIWCKKIGNNFDDLVVVNIISSPIVLLTASSLLIIAKKKDALS